MNGSVLFEGNPILSGSLNVNTGGNIEPLEVEINENGTREIIPPSGVDGYAPITIETNVPQIAPVLETLNVSQNGRYEPPEGVAGFDEVNVEVLHPLDTLTVTENGSYEPPSGVYGFSNVLVNVPTPTPTLETLNITQNGTYTPPSGVDGYDEINVNVPVNKNYLSRQGLFDLNNESPDVNALVQSSIDGFDTTWNGAPNIGFCLLGNIPLSGYNRLSFSIDEIGRNYQYVNNNNNRNFNLAFVVTNIKLSNFPQIIQLDANNNILAIKEYSGIDYYEESIDDYIDLSNISGNYYINVFMYGYNLTNVKFDIS